MSSRLKTLFLATAVFAVNLWIARELLTAEFVDHMFSIEGAFISLSRHILEKWPDLLWFPLWYGGVPYQNTYPPLHHLVVAAVAKLFGLSPGLAYHATTAVFYSLGPVTLFWLALRLSRSRVYALAAALLYSLVSPSAYLIKTVRADVGGLWHPRRLQALVHYGEGPHIASMALLPLALVLLMIAFEKRRPLWWILAGMAMASVVLTNWIGGFALAFMILAWLITRQERTGWKEWLTAGGIGAYAYLISCSWIPPSTVMGVQRNEMLVGGRVSQAPVRLASILVAVLAAGILVWLFRRYKAPPSLRFALVFLLPIASLTLSAEWLNVTLLPQAKRCHLEMDMGIALAVAFGLKWLLEGRTPRIQTAAACALAALLVFSAVKYRAYARRLDRPIDVRKTIEYKEARWFTDHTDGHRVYAPGSVGFFLNVFTDTPQFGGGFYQSVINPGFEHFNYQIMSGENAGADEGAIAAIALKAFGVDAIGVSGPRSTEAFRPFRNPNKFDGVLPVLWREGDDVIYQVPRRSRSLAHVIHAGDLPARQPVNGLDVDPLRPYVRALDDPALPVAEMKWLNQHAAVITATMRKDQILSVQMSYHAGWRATVNGGPRRIWGDHIGQIAVEPHCEGPCTVDLTYDGGLEMRIARVLCWSGLLGGVCWILFDWKHRRRSAARA